MPSQSQSHANPTLCSDAPVYQNERGYMLYLESFQVQQGITAMWSVGTFSPDPDCRIENSRDTQGHAALDASFEQDAIFNTSAPCDSVCLQRGRFAPSGQYISQKPGPPDAGYHSHPAQLHGTIMTLDGAYAVCAAHGAWDGTLGECVCTGNYVGKYCDRSCGDHGTSDASVCVCHDMYIGKYCDQNCDCDRISPISSRIAFDAYQCQ